VRRSRILALAVSAALGVAGGVAGATVMGDADQPDPLGLGVPLVNQPCTGLSLLITAWGATPDALAPAVANNSAHTRYLEVAGSCPAAWKQNGTRTDGYISYLGPYPSVAGACRSRMTGAHRGDPVVKLDRGSQMQVPCLCYIDSAQNPELTPDTVVDAEKGIYVRALQELLTEGGLNPPGHVSGSYDPETVQQIRTFQRDKASLPVTGTVDTATWKALVGRICHLYGG
jgi:hypothetical protein